MNTETHTTRAGTPGVSIWRNKYRARVWHEGRYHHLDLFDTEEEAAVFVDQARWILRESLTDTLDTSIFPEPSVGVRIRVWRLVKRVCPKKMAMGLGMKTDDYYRLEKGEHEPRLGRLRQARKILGITWEQLLGPDGLSEKE